MSDRAIERSSWASTADTLLPVSSKKKVWVAVAVLCVCVMVWALSRAQADADSDRAEQETRSDTIASRVAEVDRSASSPLALGQRSRLAGHVLDADDAPIAKADVCVSAPDSTSDLGWRPRCVKADEVGFFEIDPIGPGHHRLSASARGFIPPPVSDNGRRLELPPGILARVGPGESREDLVLRLRPGGAEVRGVIRDIMGGTVAGAQVWSASTMTESDDEGRFTLWLDVRSFVRIEVHAHGYGHAGILEHSPRGRVIEVLLRPEIILSGRVIAAEGGAPLADVAVLATEPFMLGYSGSFAGEPHVLTGEDGRFRFVGLGPGRYKPQVRAGSWRGQASESVLLVVGETPEELEIEVYPARRIEGRIVLPGAGPCQEGIVTVYDAASEIVDRGYADVDGAAKVGGLLPGAYTIEVRCVGDQPPVTITADLQEEDLLGETWEVVPPRGRALRGRVVDADGRGVAMASLVGSLREPADPEEPHDRASIRAITGDDGSFEVLNLPAGVYEFDFAQAEGMPDPVKTPKLTMPSDRDVDDFVIELPRAGALEVRVVDSSGDAVVSAELVVSRVGGGGSTLKSMPDGMWKLDPTTPGTYHVKVARPGVGGRAGPADPSREELGEEIEVVAGRTASLTLLATRRDQAITGVVRTRDGDLVADAAVWARGSETYIDYGGSVRHPEVAQTVSDIDGEFRLEGLEAGTYSVHARDGVGVEESIDGVASGSSNVTFAFPEGGSLGGRVQVRGGDPPARFTISIQPADGTRGRTEEFLHTGGTWRIVQLPPGAVTVEVQCAEGTASLGATIPEGGDLDGITLEVAARGTLRGRIVDADTGAPVRGYMAAVTSANGRARAGSLDPNGTRNSGADGSFELRQVPSGEVVLYLWSFNNALREGYADHQETLTVRSGGVTDVVIQVRRRAPAPSLETGGIELDAP